MAAFKKAAWITVCVLLTYLVNESEFYFLCFA